MKKKTLSARQAVTLWFLVLSFGVVSCASAPAGSGAKDTATGGSGGAAGTTAAQQAPPKRELYQGTALLVIDVQKDIFPVWRQETMIAAINLLIANAEKAEVPVIYIYHSAGSLIPGEPGWFLHDDIRHPDGHEQVRKLYGNAFIQTELETLLDLRKIGRVVVCGIASDGCVKNTIQGALSKGYSVVLASDAHSTPNGPNESVVDRINGIMPGWGAEVLPAAEILF